MMGRNHGVLAASAMIALYLSPLGRVYAQTGEKPGDWASLKLSYASPTANNDFATGLPIGNGRIGAKIYGNPASELLDLNDATLWSGGPHAPISTSYNKTVTDLRSALASGDYSRANSLAKNMAAGDNEAFMPMGTLALQVDGAGSYSAYSRTLELDRAVMTVKYTAGGVAYTREAFASHPDQVMVMRIYGNKAGSVTFTATQATQLKGTYAVEGGKTLVMKGRAPSHVDGYGNTDIVEWAENKGMRFESRVEIRNSGGTVTTSGTGLKVTGADTVVLLISAATSFNGIDKDPITQGKDHSAEAKGHLTKAAGKAFDQMLNTHLQDFRNLFRRVWVEVNGEKPNKQVLAYQCARYSLISCSRGDHPAPRNEQGIWNRDLVPQYHSNYTLNENPEKYYILAEPANISETLNPLFAFVGSLAQAGAATAKNMYGADGWVAHHNSDVWAKTTPATGNPVWALWPMGGIWLSLYLWEHYAFGLDKAFLQQTAYPLMKGAAQFGLDLLVDDGKGRLVTSPSTSPENSFLISGEKLTVSRGSTMDMTFLRELFTHCITASTLLGIDAAFRAELETAKAKLLPYQVGGQGQLLEWSQDFEEAEPTHRHASHLVGIWPLSQITPRGQASFFSAARKSLELRGSGGYHPDKAGLWARLQDGDKALSAYGTAWPVKFEHPPGALSEMLLQSHAGEVEILPALPKSWTSGKILGIRARGGYELDIEWSASKLTRATIRSSAGTTPLIRVQGQAVTLPDSRITLSTVALAPKGNPQGNPAFKLALVHGQYHLSLPYAGGYSASVRDIRGQEVHALRGVGPGMLKFSLRDKAPGTYTLQIQAADGKVKTVYKVAAVQR